MSIVHFKLIKLNGHTAYEDDMEESLLGSFLHGTGCARIVYYKDGVKCEIINEDART